MRPSLSRLPFSRPSPPRPSLSRRARERARTAARPRGRRGIASATISAVAAFAALCVAPLGGALAQDIDVAVRGLGGAASDASPLATLLRLVAALIVVLLAFWGCARLMRRLNGVGGATHRGLRVVGALSLGHRERLVVVQAGEEQLLLGVSAGRIERLHLLAEPLARSPAARHDRTDVAPGTGLANGAVAAAAGDGGDFRARLLAAMQRQVRS